jgi:archaeal flagellin FlaB
MKRLGTKREIGAIGIGTLIIFIALILVAAIASAVIIKTAEELEERAQESGQQAEEMVRNTPWITYAEGTVTSGNINTVDIYMKLYGSEGVDMRDVLIHLVATPQGGTSSSADLILDSGSVTTADDDNFACVQVLDAQNTWDPTGTPARFLMGERTLLKITINLNSAVVNLPPSSTMEIWTTVTNSGHVRYDAFSTPSAYPIGGIVTLQG